MLNKKTSHTSKPSYTTAMVKPKIAKKELKKKTYIPTSKSRNCDYDYDDIDRYPQCYLSGIIDGNSSIGNVYSGNL